MKLSIIIPVYNTAEYMDECMASVLGQTFKDFEVILVDDGSTDGVSPGKCDEYAGKDERVRVIHKENGGLISAWTNGLVESCGDYVSFVDSDDWIEPQMMEELYKLTDSAFKDSEIIAGNYIVEKAGERRKETQALAPGVYSGSELDKIREHLLGDEVRPVTMSRCMKLISRKLILENIKYCDPSIEMSEDVNIMLPCMCDLKRLVIADGAYFYHYRLVAESMAHAYNPKLLANLELTDKTFREILKEKNISTADEQMDREFIMILLVIMKNQLRCTDGDTLKRVRAIFLRPDIREKIVSTHVSISGTANKLLYHTMKHPGAVNVAVMKRILNAYDKRTN